MRSGWQQAPTQDEQRRQPFGPEVSWPSGYYDLEYRDGVYSYPAEDASHGLRGEMPYGEHPYAASGYTDITDFGYGDPGYSDPNYQGPASQDLGEHQRIGNDWSGAYPTMPGAANDPRYDDPRLGAPPAGETVFQRFDETRMDIPPFTDTTFDEASFDETRFDLPSYGQQLEVPGYGAQQYAAPDFGPPQFGGQPQFDQPPASFAQTPFNQAPFEQPQSGPPPQFGGTYFADPMYAEPRYDQTGDFAAVPDYPPLPGDHGDMPMQTQTRFDIPVLGAPVMESGPDIWRDSGFDISQIPDYPPDSMLPHTGMMLAADDTMMDMQGAALMEQQPQVQEFAPPPLRVREFVPEAQPKREVATPAKKTGKRRSGSSDRRQWVALGAIVVVAAGAVAVVLKMAFPSASGPAHNIETPTAIGPYQNKPALAQQMHVQDLAAKVSKLNNMASNVKYAVYQYGTGAPGANTQVFMFIGGHVSDSDASSSISTFMADYPHAKSVPAGPMGGEAACVEMTNGAQGDAAMCTWFDNDSFGTLVSSTMNTTALEQVLRTVRPSLEVTQK
jgi:hypothetical protein